MNIVFVDVSPDKNLVIMGYHPHPGLAYMAATLEQNGHRVRIVDSISSDNNPKKMVRQVVDFKPSLVGFTSTTASRFIIIDVINAVKAKTGAFIVAGGPHFNPTARDAMSKIPAIDCIVKGEGEKTIVEIAEAVVSKGSLCKIQGIFLRQDDNIFETPDRPLNTDLDSLPLPAYHLFDLKRYKTYVLSKKEIRGLGVISSRGCPCRCIFCSVTALQKHIFRKRSPEFFLDEVAYFQKTYGYNGFRFNDDTITLDRNHIVSICNGILKRKMNIRWSAGARVNTIDWDLLSLMKAAGCQYLYFGVESGSDITLATLKKGTSAAQAVKAIEMTAEARIAFDAMFMFGIPGETMQEARKSIELMNRFSVYPYSCATYSFTCIYPGTEIERLAYREGVFPKDFSWNTWYLKPIYSVLGTDPFIPCWETSLLPLEDLKAVIFKSRPFSYKVRKVFSRLRSLSLPDALSSIRIGVRFLNID